MSSLFLLYLLFYWRKFSSARCAARISLCRSLTRCRAAFSFLSLLFRDGFWWYLFLLRSLSTPSFIMRFFSREIALSGFSLRLSFTVSIWSVLGWCVQLPCSCSFLFFSTRVLYHDLLSLSSGLALPPGSPRFYPEAAWNGGVPACRSASAWWRFGMCGVGCGWWCVEQRWIKMTCYTQQCTHISPIHRHNVI